MSISAINWAFKQAGIKSADKFLLVCLANFANEDGEAYPSIARISEYTCQNRKTIIAASKRLVQANLMCDTGRRVGKTGQIIVYRLWLDELVERSQIRNSPKNGTVPFLPAKSPVFTSKESQKRDTEPLEEPSRNHLSELIGNDLADEIIAHRKKMKFPITKRAIEGLCKRLVECSDGPAAGAEMILVNGWRGFNAGWYENAKNNGNSKNGGNSAGIMDGLRELQNQAEKHDASGGNGARDSRYLPR